MHITWWHYLDSYSGGGIKVGHVARHVTMFVSFKTTMVYVVKTEMAAAS